MHSTGTRCDRADLPEVEAMDVDLRLLRIGQPCENKIQSLTAWANCIDESMVLYYCGTSVINDPSRQHHVLSNDSNPFGDFGLHVSLQWGQGWVVVSDGLLTSILENRLHVKIQ